MLLKRGTGSGERGAGNGERKSWLYFISDKELSPQYREAILEK